MKKKPKSLSLPFIEIRQGAKKLRLCSLPAGDLVKLSYVAVRREHDEEGAVQRPLNENRITGIRDFALQGGDFPACIILNWIQPATLKISGKQMRLTVTERAAQIIDGQHRVAGLEEAIAVKKSLGTMAIPVAIYENLTTRECADIFLSINTEQKPVQKSLAYDLFGIASEHMVDPAALRAADIAQTLNEDDESPYSGLVKYSGMPKARGAKGKLGIPLSTFVNAFKPLVAEKGVFDTVGVRDLVKQTRVITSFFSVLAEWYGEDWTDRNNAFMQAAGFTGAVDFLKNNLVPYCNGKRSYSVQTIRDAMLLDPNKKIYKQELAKMQGRASARKVTDLLIERFEPAKQLEQEIEY